MFFKHALFLSLLFCLFPLNMACSSDEGSEARTTFPEDPNSPEDPNLAYLGSCGYDLNSYGFTIHASINAYYFIRANVYSLFSDSFSSTAGRYWAVLNLKDIGMGERLVFSFEPYLNYSMRNIILAYTDGSIFNNDTDCFLSSSNGVEKFSHDPMTLSPRGSSTIGYNYDLTAKSITFTQAASYYHIVLSLSAIPSMPRVERL